MKSDAIFSSQIATIDAERIGYELAKDMTMTLPQQRATAIQCHAGMLWLTIAGDAEDYFLRNSESMICDSGEAIVVEAFGVAAKFQTSRV